MTYFMNMKMLQKANDIYTDLKNDMEKWNWLVYVIIFTMFHLRFFHVNLSRMQCISECTEPYTHTHTQIDRDTSAIPQLFQQEVKGHIKCLW